MAYIWWGNILDYDSYVDLYSFILSLIYDFYKNLLMNLVKTNGVLVI